MNKILTFLLLGVTASGFSQVFTATTPIPVATGLGNYHPQMELTTDGVPAVIWVDNNGKDLYFAKHNGVDAFNTPVQLNPAGMDVQSYNWSGPDLKVEGNNIYVA